jgi:hypothetical protein
VFSIKDNFLKNCSNERSREISSFFQLKNLFKNIEIKNMYLSSNHINSILLDEDAVEKIRLISRMKYNIIPDEEKLMLESLEFNPKEFKKFIVNDQNEVLQLIKEHMQQDHIKKLKLAKREQQRESLLKKELIKSRLESKFDLDFLDKKIVSVDFEYFNLDVYEIGVSTYYNGEKTYNHYLINENYINKKTEPEKQFKFQFGKTEIIPEIMISSVIQDHLKEVDYILSHGYSNDYLILKKYGLDLEKENKLKILDTGLYYQKHFDKNQVNALNLKSMLNIFNIESTLLHNAGNDSAYTLDLMLEMHNRIKAPSNILKFKNN